MLGIPVEGGHGQLTLARAEFSRIWTTNEALLLKIRGQRKVSPRAGNKGRKRPVSGACGRIRGLGFLCSNPALFSLEQIPQLPSRAQAHMEEGRAASPHFSAKAQYPVTLSIDLRKHIALFLGGC